ncbi:hypothetical protein DVDV_2919 [Desulfovibrio sp. DV]|nr:hypothetical protein DVDV_2919 [Desulfovibrio sp. DV]
MAAATDACVIAVVGGHKRVPPAAKGQCPLESHRGGVCESDGRWF